jgi:hypothetical protein
MSSLPSEIAIASHQGVHEAADSGHEDARRKEHDNEGGPERLQACLTSLSRIQHKLNVDIGFGWWKRYIAAAFWSNISMPINLSITLMTAMTTAQATTQALLSQHFYVSLSISTLVLTVVNTFFRPHTQMNDNIKLMTRWTEFGNTLESVYYSSSSSEEIQTMADKILDCRRRQKAYEALQSDINAFENNISPEAHNFLTDLIHTVARMTILNARDKWLDLDDLARDV